MPSGYAHYRFGTQVLSLMPADIRGPIQRHRTLFDVGLHGLLAHYCLDSQCHPFVYAMTDDTELDHSELETEFDRFLLTLDGVKRPREANISRSLRLNTTDAAVVAGFYPEITARDVRSCFRSMALSQQLLTLPTVAGYAAVSTFTKLAGGNTSGKAMTLGPNPSCAHLDEKLLELYDQALEKFPRLLEQLNRHMAYGASFGNDFKVNFDRG